MKNKFLIFLVLATQFSCNLDDDISGDDYSFTGRLYKNCEKEPHANMELNVYTENDKTFSSDEKFYQQIQTDDNGRFYFEFGSRGFDRFNVYNNTNNLVCRIGVTSDRWLYEPNQTSELYSRTRLRHPVKILTDKAYTVQDTLFVEAGGNYYPVLSLAGPFTNNYITETELLNFELSSALIAPYSNKTENEVRIYWCIGRENLVINNPNDPDFTTNEVKGVQQGICDGDTIVVDMR
jgi:hypothetical protein